MRFIFTCREAHRELTLYEFKQYDETFKFAGWLDAEVGHAETALSRDELPRLIRNAPVIFVRHIFAVDIECEPDSLPGQALALCECAVAAEQSGAQVSVQVRGCANPCMEQEGLAERIADHLTGAGINCDLKNGEIILSVYIGEQTVYLGAGDAAENLSRWRGGMPFYSKSPGYGFVSRAEFKLLEAFECFNIPAEGIKNALDLGAAPGGWTKALADRGAGVVAVDPNRLDSSLYGNPSIKHYAMTAQQYLALKTGETFDIIVDDMKIDPEKTIAIVKRCCGCLADGGYAVVTLKLEHGFSYKRILDCMKSVQPYKIIGARQLFHNRSEITLVLRKPAGEGR